MCCMEQIGILEDDDCSRSEKKKTTYRFIRLGQKQNKSVRFAFASRGLPDDVDGDDSDANVDI